MENFKRVELSNELILSLLGDVPKDSVIMHCERSETGIVIYLQSQEFEFTKEGCLPEDLINEIRQMI